MADPSDVAHLQARAAQAFDAVAADYDGAYGEYGNRAMAWMRAESIELLAEVFSDGSSLLELGCGTGVEALALARRGCKVLATDVSPAMAAIAGRKARQAGLQHRVCALALPAGSIRALKPSMPFDGAYASFGGLNCEPNLARVAEGLGQLVRPCGAFVCGVMNRTYVFEVLWYLLHGRSGSSLRRMQRGWLSAPVGGLGATNVAVLTRYLGLRQLRSAFAPWFRVEHVQALPLLMPPPYAASLYHRHARLVGRLERWDRALRSRMPLAMLGDHLVVVFRHL